MRVQIIKGKVYDIEGRLLWIDGYDGPGRPMTFNDLLLEDFAALQSVLEKHGHRAATRLACKERATRCRVKVARFVYR
jgi:hypothetical protein